MREIERDGKKVIVPASPILKKNPTTSPTDWLSTIGGILVGPVSPIPFPPPIQNNSANKSGDKK